MQTIEPFHTLLAAIALVVFPTMVYHRLRSRTGETLDRSQEGLMILLTVRLIGLATLIGVAVYLIDPPLMAWASAPFPLWLRWAGSVVGIVGAVTVIWTVHTLGPNLTDTVVTRERHTLVVNGPYRWVRHPFYGSVALLLAGFAFGAANWLFLIGGVAVIALLVLRTDAEEDRLVARFGDTYMDYMKHTSRFVPVRHPARPHA
jgi:protein-S-isoprenylcysteine O-methyltransferase Ste14